MSEHISAVEAQALLDAATPGEWGPLTFRGDGLGWDIDGPEAGIRGQFDNEADAAVAAAAKRALAEVVRLRRELDAAQLRSIEARNPGIDMDEVRATRARLLGGGE